MNNTPATKPNLIFVFADQWRYQATGFAGNRDVHTPHLDRLASESANFQHAIANQPVCSPFRASLITGRYPLSHGVFLNDLRLNQEAVSIADAYNQAGYETAYIGKWHLDGTGRSTYIPPERRQGFQYWKVLECTHDYFDSGYFSGNDPQPKKWDGYDAYAQTDDALAYLEQRTNDSKPFSLFLSWGPPHNPYRRAPAELLQKYEQANITLRENVPPEDREKALQDIAGYYAHCEALDQCLGKIMQKLATTGLEDHTILVFASDHGDMLYSQGQQRKQRPWDESIRIPFLVRCPATWQTAPTIIPEPFGSVDMMPTLLALSGIPIPDTVEGRNCADLILGKRSSEDRAQLLLCPSPFGEFTRRDHGREYRGVRTMRYTYVRDLDGPWMLFDNQTDPYQRNNLVNKPEMTQTQQELEAQLRQLLHETGDPFLPGPQIINTCGYRVDESGTVSYHPDSGHFGQISTNFKTRAAYPST